MKNLVQFVLISTLLAVVFGCSNSSETAAAEARIKAADARVEAADANARVAAADAHVKAADARVSAADAHVRAADAEVNASKADDRVKTEADASAKAARKVAKAKLMIPSGTVLKVVLIDPLSSETSQAGDRFLASLSEPVVIDGATLLQKGTKVRGHVIAAEGAGRVNGRASISLALTDVMQGDRMVAITTDTLEAISDATTGRDAKIIAGGAGLGAVIGAITGGKKGAGIGAVTGGGAGTGVVLATKGKEIHYGSETRLNFTLTNSVEM